MSLDPVALIDRPVTVISPHGEVQGQILAATTSDVLVRWISPQRSDEIRADWFNQATLVRGTWDEDPRAVRLKCLPWRVLITGAAGFLGQTLQRHLEALGYEVTGFDTWIPASCVDKPFVRDSLLASDDFSWLVERAKPDVIYHLAAISGVPACQRDPRHAARVNIDGTRLILDAARAQDNPPRVVIAGSGEEYGEGTYCTPDSPLKPRNIYGATKAAATMLAVGYASAYDLPVHVVRMANLYGPGQDESKFIPLVIGKLLRGEIVELHANGAPKRDWLYIDDACDALIKLGLGPKQDDVVFNLPGFHERSLLEVATTIRDVLQSCTTGNMTPYADLLHPVEGGSLVGNVRMVTQDKLNWQPAVSIEDGIAKTVSAYLDARTTSEESQIPA